MLLKKLWIPLNFRYNAAAYSNGAYGSDGYHHYMRSYDPNYDAYFPEGPSVEDKWRNTYPYVPTSYNHTSSDGELRFGYTLF